jgi:hypothetical protein
MLLQQFPSYQVQKRYYHCENLDSTERLSYGKQRNYTSKTKKIQSGIKKLSKVLKKMAVKFRQDLCPMTLNKSLTFLFVDVRDQ